MHFIILHHTPFSYCLYKELISLFKLLVFQVRFIKASRSKCSVFFLLNLCYMKLNKSTLVYRTTVGHRPFTEPYSSMAAQTAPSSDILAAKRLVSKFILNYELVDSCSSASC